MLKRQKKSILKNKYKLLKSNTFHLYTIHRFYKFNSGIKFKNRIFFLKKNILFKNFNVCLISGKSASRNTYLKFNRNISNSFVRFNYFANIKAFGK